MQLVADENRVESKQVTGRSIPHTVEKLLNKEPDLVRELRSDMNGTSEQFLREQYNRFVTPERRKVERKRGFAIVDSEKRVSSVEATMIGPLQFELDSESFLSEYREMSCLIKES